MIRKFSHQYAGGSRRARDVIASVTARTHRGGGCDSQHETTGSSSSSDSSPGIEQGVIRLIRGAGGRTVSASVTRRVVDLDNSKGTRAAAGGTGSLHECFMGLGI